ncbi:MAG: hypothetical protein WBO36_16390 [Saprospiraceae bacterium]
MNRIDRIFKQKLEHSQSAISEDVWNKIESQLNQKKDSNKKRWIPLFLIFGLLGGASVYYLTSDFHTPSVDKPVFPITSHDLDFASTTTQESDKQPSPEILDIAGDQIVGSFESSDRERGMSLSASTNDNYPVLDRTAEVETNKLLLSNRDIVEYTSSDREFSTIAPLSIGTKKLKSYNKISFKSPYRNNGLVKTCPFNANSNGKSIDLYFSQDMVSKSLTTHDPALESHISLRRQTEDITYAFSVGARFGYNIGYRWNIHSGVNYSQVNEKFEYVDPESNQTRVITIKDYVYQGGKIVDSIITEEVVLIPGDTKVSVNNTYRSFDIPVLGRYTILATEKFSLSAMGGVFVNLAFIQRGMIMGMDNISPYDLQESQRTPQFKTQLGVSGYGALSMAYHVAPKWDILLEPNIRVQTESMTTAPYPVRQQLHNMGWSAGLRYQF